MADRTNKKAAVRFGDEDSLSQKPDVADDGGLSVVVLGVQGSGKTVFLSVLGYTFEEEVGAFGLQLLGSFSNGTRNYVNRIYRAMRYDHEFPMSTNDTERTDLLWSVRNGSRPLFTIESLDCAGETIIDALAHTSRNAGASGEETGKRRTKTTGRGGKQLSQGFEDLDEESANDGGQGDVRDIIRARIAEAKVICLFLNPADFNTHVADLSATLSEKDQEDAFYRSDGMAFLLQTILDTQAADGKKVVLAITQTGDQDVRRRIEELGGAKAYLFEQDSRVSIMRGAETANVIAVSAVNEIVWKSPDGELVEPCDENSDSAKVIGRTWTGLDRKSHFAPKAHPNLNVENPSSGMVEFLIAIGGDCPELKPLAETLSALRNAQFSYASTRRNENKGEKERLDDAQKLKKALDAYLSAAESYVKEHLEGNTPNAGRACAKTNAHLDEEKGAILRWIVAEPLIDAALRDAAAKNQKLPDNFEATMVDQVNRAIDKAIAEMGHQVSRDAFRFVAPGDLKLDADWLADQFEKYLEEEKSSRQTQLQQIGEKINAANTYLDDGQKNLENRQYEAARDFTRKAVSEADEATRLIGGLRDRQDNFGDRAHCDELEGKVSAIKVGAQSLDSRITKAEGKDAEDARQRAAEIKRREIKERQQQEENRNTRRRRFRMAIRVALLIASALTLFAYNAWKRPFIVRHAEIDAMLHKCETCMAGLNELGGNGAEKRLKDALARLPGVSPDKPDGGAVEPLGLDPSLYVAEDRPKAIELNDSYKNATDEWNRARNDFKAASTRAAAQASDIRELLKDSGYKDISKAMSETERSLDELNALHALKRPKAEPTSSAVKRFEEVSARADKARAAFSNWMAKADAAVTGAKTAADAFGAALARLESANGRLAAIREEANALRIDRNVPWLSEIRTGITNGITAVESAEDLLRKAMDENPKERARLFDKARGYCREVAGKAAALDNEHGALLPREAVESARKAPNELDGIAKEEESAWENRRRAASALLGRAKAFQEEGAMAIKTLDSLIKEGTGQPDSAHISRLPQKAEGIEKELSAAAETLSTAELEKRLVLVVSKARKDFEAIEAAKPDIPACRGEIREGAKACMASLKAVGESLGGLKKTVEDGGGVAKAAIQEAVAECARQFDSAEADLRALEGATPANGRDVIKLRGNLDGARNSMDSLRKRVTELDAEIEKAIGEGRFSPASWKEGALAGKPNDALRSKAVLRGDVLCAPGGEASQAYQWEFGLDIDEPGSHKVEVRVSPSARNGVCNLNTAMPIRTFKGGEHGKRSKGGWIKADCILTSGNVRRTNSFFMPNKDPMTPREAVMLEANWQLPKGRASFLLGLNLSVDMRQIEEKDRAKLTDIYKGWNPGGIEIRIFVDGEQVRQFWHLAR